MSGMRMKLRQRGLGACGVSILEVLIAIGLASILLAIAVPSFMSTLPRIRLSFAARQVASDLQVARMKAIAQNTAYTVNFNTSTTYSFPGDTRDFGQLYPGITFTTTGNPVFTPRGTASTTATITLSNGSDPNKQVLVSAVGRVTMQ
jgi:type IV fimbrial biogenesis protein FimT